MRREVTERQGGGVAVTVALALVLAAVWAALAAAAALFGGAAWLVAGAAAAALAFVTVAAAAYSARAARNRPGALGPAPPQLPPVDPARYRWAPPGPDRPTGQRPTGPVRYSCPVEPGWTGAVKPRTVADLRRWPPRRDLSSWQ